MESDSRMRREADETREEIREEERGRDTALLVLPEEEEVHGADLGEEVLATGAEVQPEHLLALSTLGDLLDVHRRRVVAAHRWTPFTSHHA